MPGKVPVILADVVYFVWAHFACARFKEHIFYIAFQLTKKGSKPRNLSKYAANLIPIQLHFRWALLIYIVRRLNILFWIWHPSSVHKNVHKRKIKEKTLPKLSSLNILLFLLHSRSKSRIGADWQGSGWTFFLEVDSQNSMNDIYEWFANVSETTKCINLKEM